jgi:hypothetical protein
LEPNRAVVARFGGAAGFDVLGRRPVSCVTLDELEARHGPFDVLRLTTQGMEYQLLSAGLTTVRKAVCVEVSGGLVDNYVGQYPFAVVAPLLYGAGYSLVDLTTASRPDAGWDHPVFHPPVEYRGRWLRDDLIHAGAPTEFRQGVKLLALCKILGHHPFGHEFALSMHTRSLLPERTAGTLRKAGFWAQPWPLAGETT